MCGCYICGATNRSNRLDFSFLGSSLTSRRHIFSQHSPIKTRLYEKHKKKLKKKQHFGNVVFQYIDDGKEDAIFFLPGDVALLFLLANCFKKCLYCIKMSEETAQSSLIGTQADTGWRPDTPAAGTSNGPIVPLKPQRQRALGKPLLPVATDLYPSFLPPLFIRQVISPSIHCFHVRTSFSPAPAPAPVPAPPPAVL